MTSVFLALVLIGAIYISLSLLSSVSKGMGRAEAEASTADRSFARLWRFFREIRKPLPIGADLVRRLREWSNRDS